MVEVPLKNKLDDAIKAALDPSSVGRVMPAPPKLRDIIKNEMTLFENGGCRGRFLESCYQYLLTVPPTSVESERAFSASGSFATKIRSKLNDDSLNALVGLRFYFTRKEKQVEK